VDVELGRPRRRRPGFENVHAQAIDVGDEARADARGQNLALQWRHVEHLSMRAAEKTVARWLSSSTDESLAIKLARAQTDITFAKGTPHK